MYFHSLWLGLRGVGVEGVGGWGWRGWGGGLGVEGVGWGVGGGGGGVGGLGGLGVEVGGGGLGWLGVEEGGGGGGALGDVHPLMRCWHGGDLGIPQVPEFRCPMHKNTRFLLAWREIITINKKLGKSMYCKVIRRRYIFLQLIPCDW